MIELRVATSRTDVDLRAERRVVDLLVAHSVTITDDDPDVPLIIEAGRRVSADAFDPYLDDLAEDVAAWRTFQTDACYVDDDGSIC